MNPNGVDLAFTAPTYPVSINDTKGRHWSWSRARLDPWKDQAWVAAHNWRIRSYKRGYQARPITVQVVIPFRQGRRRDPHNYTGTVVKAVVDGLVRAAIVPDDNPRWVSVLEPELLVVSDPLGPLTCTVRIRPREDQTP